MKRTREKSGLTLVEILTVLAIISLLAGILIPAVTAVKTAAKETKQKAQFMTIELGLTTFKDDSDCGGDYPPSYYGYYDPTGRFPLPGMYCGSQKLAEALLGRDLLGFHPRSQFRYDGMAPNPLDPTRLAFVYDTTDLSARKGPYLESGTKNAFTLADLFPSHPLATQPGADRYVICDVFGATKVTLPDGSTVKAGAPILYYKADPSGRFNDASLVDPMMPYDNRGNIYNCLDNLTIVGMKETVDGASVPAFSDSVTFYDYITDPKITARLPDTRPYNPSSYILISAGADGLYGTGDDICNFGY